MVQKKRLLQLADLLEEDAKNKKGVKFDLGTWGSADEVENFKMSCDTTACAFGLAALSGKFKRAGLSYRIQKANWSDVHYLNPIFTDKDGLEFEGFAAAIKIFGINERDAFWLFSEEAYGGPTTGAKGERKVAARIRAFVEGEKPPQEFYSSYAA